MKKLLLVILVAFLLNGCRYINTTEAYHDAKASPKLTVPEELDKPNSSSTLDVPKATKEGPEFGKKDMSPPDMPIRTKQSEDAKKSINNRDGYAVLSVKTDLASAWKTMNLLSLENWTISNTDQDSCSMAVHYDDQDARDREKASFLKKIFTRDKYYTDYTGDFNITCKKVGSVIEIKFAEKDGTAGKSFLADNVMNDLYGKFE